MSHEVACLQKAVKRMEEMLEISIKKLKEVEAANRTLRQKESKLSLMNAQLTAANAKLEAKTETLEARAVALESSLAEKTAQMAALEDEIAKLRSQLLLTSQKAENSDHQKPQPPPPPTPLPPQPLQLSQPSRQQQQQPLPQQSPRQHQGHQSQQSLQQPPQQHPALQLQKPSQQQQLQQQQSAKQLQQPTLQQQQLPTILRLHASSPLAEKSAALTDQEQQLRSKEQLVSQLLAKLGRSSTAPPNQLPTGHQPGQRSAVPAQWISGPGHLTTVPAQFITAGPQQLTAVYAQPTSAQTPPTTQLFYVCDGDQSSFGGQHQEKSEIIWVEEGGANYAAQHEDEYHVEWVRPEEEDSSSEEEKEEETVLGLATACGGGQEANLGSIVEDSCQPEETEAVSKSSVVEIRPTMGSAPGTGDERKGRLVSGTDNQSPQATVPSYTKTPNAPKPLAQAVNEKKAVLATHLGVKPDLGSSGVVDDKSVLLETKTAAASCGKPASGTADSLSKVEAVFGNEKVGRPRTCKECKAVFASVKELGAHEALTRHNLHYTCPHCNKRFKQKIQQQRHVAQIHIREPRYQCSKCHRAFRSEFSCKRHERNEKYHAEVANKPLVLECPDCGKMFPRRRKWCLMMHMKTHQTVPEHTCHICGKSFSTAGYMNVHKKGCAGIKEFQCPVCFRRFSKKNVFINHVRLHTGEKPYPCKICNIAFRTHDLYLKHGKKRHGAESARHFTSMQNVLCDDKLMEVHVLVEDAPPLIKSSCSPVEEPAILS